MQYRELVENRSIDLDEIEEWRQALLSVVHSSGAVQARTILDMLATQAQQLNLGWRPSQVKLFANTISPDKQALFPGDLTIEERLVAIMRWNALAMVVRANREYGELGGHISSYASAAHLFEVGFNHFFAASSDTVKGDLVFFQPHSAPGIYARAFLEGRLEQRDLEFFRREIAAHAVGARGLPSYPHPWQMPDFWQFPTGSMGIGPINSIYQARFLRYLRNRGLIPPNRRNVWGFFGDGEMDEPESMSALTLAARENLNNLIWVINCNLQRLDGPVRGNGRIVDELESQFSAAGWNVIKLIWGSEWDNLFARDTSGQLLDTLSGLVDGQLQTLSANDGEFNRTSFFGQSKVLTKLVEGLSNKQIEKLNRGGHDIVKIYAAYAKAMDCADKPTVILAHTMKGFGMGSAGQGKMTSHQQKILDDETLISIRDRLDLPISDEEAVALHFFKPADDSPEIAYVLARRQELGGFTPTRTADSDSIPLPRLDEYAGFAIGANGKAMSTTLAFVRMLTKLVKHDSIGPRVVPIIADEGRTFGMQGLFRSIGIYSSEGQKYDPEDIDSISAYCESIDGQILEEGINEAGAISSWVAAATSYSTHGLKMLPFYIFYSMFGFQRIGDLIWAAADQRARGFLIGATSGKTTLGGEGLQHQDGSSHLIAESVPNCRSYDPAFAGELGIIIDHGMRQMLELERDEFYYITVTNERYSQPNIDLGNDEAIIRGMYEYTNVASRETVAFVRLLGSGAIMGEVIAAAEILAKEWCVSAQVFSVTSYTELARDARQVSRWNRLNPGQSPLQSHVEELLDGSTAIVAASDYVRALPNLIAPYIEAKYEVLGTDGFGRSDTRSALRRNFEVDRENIIVAALYALYRDGDVSVATCEQAVSRYNLDGDALAPWLA